MRSRQPRHRQPVLPRCRARLGEDTERYEIDILDVVRTLSATSPAATYTAAQQTADFGSPQPSISLRIHQLSTTAGRGTPRSAVL